MKNLGCIWNIFNDDEAKISVGVNIVSADKDRMETEGNRADYSFNKD